MLAFLILSLALGPGLLVNEVFKAESGRARPGQVEQFGGEKSFTPVFQPADQCTRNCSFVSGHAAMGFYLIGLAWVRQDRRWLWLGIAAGALVGAARILQGGHFLSDVLFGFWVVYGVNVLLARWLLGRWSITGSVRTGPS
jgi:lipid A 4'-phosphatase